MARASESEGRRNSFAKSPIPCGSPGTHSGSVAIQSHVHRTRRHAQPQHSCDGRRFPHLEPEHRPPSRVAHSRVHFDIGGQRSVRVRRRRDVGTNWDDDRKGIGRGFEGLVRVVGDDNRSELVRLSELQQIEVDTKDTHVVQDRGLGTGDVKLDLAWPREDGGAASEVEQSGDALFLVVQRQPFRVRVLHLDDENESRSDDRRSEPEGRQRGRGHGSVEPGPHADCGRWAVKPHQNEVVRCRYRKHGNEVSCRRQIPFVEVPDDDRVAATNRRLRFPVAGRRPGGGHATLGGELIDVRDDDVGETGELGHRHGDVALVGGHLDRVELVAERAEGVELREVADKTGHWRFKLASRRGARLDPHPRVRQRADWSIHPDVVERSRHGTLHQDLVHPFAVRGHRDVEPWRDRARPDCEDGDEGVHVEPRPRPRRRLELRRIPLSDSDGRDQKLRVWPVRVRARGPIQTLHFPSVHARDLELGRSFLRLVAWRRVGVHQGPERVRVLEDRTGVARFEEVDHDVVSSRPDVPRAVLDHAIRVGWVTLEHVVDL
eukprot:1505597-Rhodomonas_salina.2